MRDPARLALACALALLFAGCGDKRESAGEGNAPGSRQGETKESAEGDGPRTVASAPRSWSFQEGAIGELPPGFRVGEGTWHLARVEDRRGLLQEAKNGNPIYNIVLIDATRFQDVRIQVDVRALAGEFDQGGGPVWRARDEHNYYVARWNPLEDNYRVYKVVDGLRTELASAETEPGSPSRHIEIRMVGSKIECLLDGKRLLHVEDTTFPEAGAVGLWAKSDARTLFSALEVGPP